MNYSDVHRKKADGYLSNFSSNKLSKSTSISFCRYDKNAIRRLKSNKPLLFRILSRENIKTCYNLFDISLEVIALD